VEAPGNSGGLWWQGAWVLLAAIVAADLLDYVSPFAGAAGTLLWFGTYGYVIAFAVLSLRDVCGAAVRARAPYGLMMVAIYLGITVINVVKPDAFSAETAQEIGCTVHTLNAGGDLGFHSTCLFGYPMRQFLLQALPTVVFGPTPVNMVALGGVYFLCGIAIFAGGVIRLLRSEYLGALIGALLLSVFLQLYYWNLFYIVFEQSVFPLCFALILGGLALYFRAGDEHRTLPLVGIVLLWLTSGYTPGLAVYGLAVVALAYVAFRRPDLRLRIAALLVLTLVALRISSSYRADVQTVFSPTPFSDLWIGLQHLVYQNQGIPWSSPFLVFPLLVVVALALSGMLGRPAFVIGAWVVLTVAAAIVSRGYAFYTVDFRLHRAMVVVPVLITMCALLLRARPLARLRHTLELLLLVSVMVGIKYYLNYHTSLPPTSGLQFDVWLQRHLPQVQRSPQPVTLSWMPSSDQDLPGAEAALAYFLPSVQSVVLDQTQLEHGCPALKRLTGVIVAQSTAPCFGTLQVSVSAGRLHQVGIYSTASMKLNVFTVGTNVGAGQTTPR
jgi:hypothetical protein